MFLNENNNLVNVLKVNESKERCMAILTISSSEDSQEFNFKLCEKLASELKSFGFGCYIAQGHDYKKFKGVEQTTEPKDYNLVVIGWKCDEKLLKKVVIKLSQDYKLNSVLFKSCIGKVIVYDAYGKVKNLLGKFHANRILKYMKKLKQNSSYVLDSISDFKDGYVASFFGAVRRHQKIEDLLSEGKPFINIFKEIEFQENCMVILTSPKPLNQEEENQRLNQELSDYLSKYGFGFREAKGHYARRVDGIEGIRNFIEDYTLVISGKESGELLFKLSVKLCEKYHQESFLYKNSLGEIIFCNAKGKVLHKLGRKFKADKVGEYMASGICQAICNDFLIFFLPKFTLGSFFLSFSYFRS